jgi:1-acyl-sn-glycerol-3-phosphate acyltransferase
LLKALGIDKLVFPAQKDEAGVYKLERRTYSEVLAYLDGPGRVLWLSLTGKTRGNGLLEGDLRTGAALFSHMKRLPVMPMGLVTKEERDKSKVVKVRFGEPIGPPEVGEMTEFEKSDFLIDFSKLAMCEIAKLLPPGQRGDFENVEEKGAEIERRLETYWVQTVAE